ncbi:hypothetical protein [Streptomyces mirabilis]|uniref:hypothetical protein n=1 Tax=Streptomyces mirabilis TaxID=68239 RepID=UPI0033A56EBB
MRFSRTVVQEVRECPWGGLKAACPHCVSLTVQEATQRARSRTGNLDVIRLAWLIGLVEKDPGLEQAARRVMWRKPRAKKKSATVV